MRKEKRALPKNRHTGEHELRLVFKTTSSLNTSALTDLVQHIARIAAEEDYNSLLKTGKIPYDDPKNRGR